MAFDEELSTNVYMNVYRDAVKDEIKIEEDICNVRGLCFGLWDSSRQLEILVGNDKYI